VAGVGIVVAPADLTEDPPTPLFLDGNPEVLRCDDDD
jgi:hypothetical protein